MSKIEVNKTIIYFYRTQTGNNRKRFVYYRKRFAHLEMILTAIVDFAISWYN